MNILKQFGLGLLWALLTPLILVAVALVMVFGIFNFIIQFFIMIFNFFAGKKLFPPMKEDLQATFIIEKAIKKKQDEEEQKTPQKSQNVFVQQNFYGSAPAKDASQTLQSPPLMDASFLQSEPAAIESSDPAKLKTELPMAEDQPLAKKPEPLIFDTSEGGDNDDE